MHRFGRTFLVVLVLALATATPGCGGDDNEAGGGETTTAAMGPTKVRLAFSTWNGYLALVVGVKEGFFKNHGADVSYSVIEDPVQRFNAFKAGRLDAIASTTDTFSRTNAKVLVDTKTYPDIVTDQVAFQPDFIKDHPETVKAFIQGYADAIDFIKTNETKAFADVKDFLKQKPDEIKAIMTEVPLWTIAENKKFYGTESSPGPVYDIFDKASEFWKNIGEIDTPADAKEAIDPSFVNEVGG